MRANEVEKERQTEYMKEYRKANRDLINKKKRDSRARNKTEKKAISPTVYDIDKSTLEHNEEFYLKAARRMVWDDTGKPWWRNWNKIAGTVSPQGYRHIKVSINYNKRTIRAHRLRWYQETGELVELLDHEDGDRDNNRMDNIGPATWSQNALNSRKTKGVHSSDYQGVIKPKNSELFNVMYEAKVIGTYKYEIQAALAYDRKLEEVQDKYRVRNFSKKCKHKLTA